eukprot:scaffold31297_cov66-Cyclotella_meneghiniana.AAC.7
MQHSLQLDVHVVMRHDADFVCYQVVQQRLHRVGGRVEEGGLGFGEGPLRRERAVGSDEERGEGRRYLLGWRGMNGGGSVGGGGPR